MAYEMIAFALFIATFDVVRRIADAGGAAAEIVDMFQILMLIMVAIFVAMIFIHFLIILKDALMLWLPKKKKFSEMRGD